jgi:hypothetical protein
MSIRRKYTNKERDELQVLKYENKKLKKQVSTLRKQLSKLDIDRYENIKDIVARHHQEDLNERLLEEKKKLQKKYKCFDCEDGVLQLHHFSRQDGLFYYRKCTECDNRTKMKPYKDGEGTE